MRGRFTMGLLILATVTGCNSEMLPLFCFWGTSEQVHREEGILIRQCGIEKNDEEVAHGIRKMWFNGKLSNRSHFKDGQLDGKVESWRNGSKTEEGQYQGGKRIGRWKTWHPNGILSSDGSYEDTRIGKWIYWHSNGRKQSEGSYHNGKPDGAWTYWYPSGNKEKEGSYSSGKREGRWVHWYDDGKTKKEEIEYQADRFNGLYVKYSPAGELTSKEEYRFGEPEGDWTNRYPDGKQSGVGRFEGGKREGEWTFFYPSGLKNEEGGFKGGKRNGRWVFWWENGRKNKEETYELGEKEGPAIIYNWDESVREKGVYRKGKKEGVWTYGFYGEERKQIYRADVALPPAISGNVKVTYFENGKATVQGKTYKIVDEAGPAIIRSDLQGKTTWKLRPPSGSESWELITFGWCFLMLHDDAPVVAIKNQWGWESAAWDKYEFFSLQQKEARYLGSFTISEHEDYMGDDPGVEDSRIDREILGISQDPKGIVIRAKRYGCEGGSTMPACAGQKRAMEEDYLLTHKEFRLK